MTEPDSRKTGDHHPRGRASALWESNAIPSVSPSATSSASNASQRRSGRPVVGSGCVVLPPPLAASAEEERATDEDSDGAAEARAVDLRRALRLLQLLLLFVVVVLLRECRSGRHRKETKDRQSAPNTHVFPLTLFTGAYTLPGDPVNPRPRRRNNWRRSLLPARGNQPVRMPATMKVVLFCGGLG